LRSFDPNLDERLDKLYNEGLGAYWLEEWDKAIRCFQTILEVKPDYPDAANKFELSRRQQRLLTLYNQVLEAEEDGDWLLVVSRLDELLSLAPDYRDARQRLEVAKRNRLLSDLYAEARQLAQAGKHRAVLNVFAQMSKLQPDFPDPDGLCATAEEEVVKEQRQAELENMYTQALREMDAGNWATAEEVLLKLQSEASDYPGINRLLERAQIERAKNEAARQRNEQVTILSQQAVGLARARQWRQVLAKIAEIQAIDPTYQDSDQLEVTAREEIERQTQETQREAQLAEMYAAAVKSLEAGEYQKALEQWGEVQVLDPKYPDRKKVKKTARKKLKELAKPEAPPKKLSK
jgi:tetratricopeptide (TPR) repeat protein